MKDLGHPWFAYDLGVFDHFIQICRLEVTFIIFYEIEAHYNLTQLFQIVL